MKHPSHFFVFVAGMAVALGACTCPTPGEDAGQTTDVLLADASMDTPSIPDVVTIDTSFVPPFDSAVIDAPGFCTPAPPYDRDRYAGDSAAIRYLDQVQERLLRCALAKGCANATFVVDAMGVVVEIVTTDDGILECVERELLGLCLPTRASEEVSEQACYI